MKIGRNEPCPCGSGKKYKKCCYLKKQSAIAESSLESRDDDYSEDSFRDDELMQKALTNFRRFFLDKKPHIKEYYKIRKMHSEIVNAMVRYHESGKFKHEISADTADTAAQPKKHGGSLCLIESNFDFDTRYGINAFYDMLIYKSSINTSCISEDFIRDHRYRKPEKVEFLHSMLDSEAGLFEITGVDKDEGYAHLKEVFSGKEYKIVDVGMSGAKNYGDIYIYTRIITYKGISFGTGLNLIFNKSDKFIRDHIRHHKKDYSKNGEFLRFSQVYNRYCQYPDRVRVVSNTLK